MKGLLFLFIIIADDPATRLGCYGDKVAITPNLDRLASEGVVFAKDYCPDAVCTPSRTSFMLGLKMIGIRFWPRFRSSRARRLCGAR
jgi:iduronate 2-sulfatase